MRDYFEGRFEGQNIIVTGGTSGIGKSVCIRAAKEGGNVVIVGRNEERGQAILNEITENGGSAMFIAADVSKESDVTKLFNTVTDKLGEIHVVINNAGIVGHGERIDELATEEWLNVINTNLNSAFYCCREAAKNMINHKKGGSIVNVSSIAGSTGFYRSSAYVASKHGLNGLTKAVANDLAMFNIRCNSVSPAGTSTPLNDRSSIEVKAKIGAAMAAGKSLEEAKSETMIGGKTETLQKRSATSEEQTATILYIASDEANHITGSIIMSDGGYTAY
ncbi:MAG: SDR family oxidoreductase [Clostridium sp.]|uniref:SDR family NAD(P)-dependent oxidoreductase n=1 Tax=Clostridium sp. TaxID=1506 RepID=UPI00301EF140